MQKIIAFIPARMAATRFPNKPLAPITGLPMIEHVRRRTAMCGLLTDTYVATCDQVICDVVASHGGKAVMTADTYERCTDRVAEAARKIPADIVVNVQGDEPLVMPEMIEAMIRPLLEDPGLQAVNLAMAITSDDEFNSPNTVKLVLNQSGEALYMSREPIPSVKKASDNGFKKLKQLGLMAFRGDFLQTFCKLDPTPLEIIESVDMNRMIEHGYRLKVIEVTGTMIGVDIPSDVQAVETVLKGDPVAKRYL